MIPIPDLLCLCMEDPDAKRGQFRQRHDPRRQVTVRSVTEPFATFLLNFDNLLLFYR